MADKVDGAVHFGVAWVRYAVGIGRVLIAYGSPMDRGMDRSGPCLPKFALTRTLGQ